MSSDRREDQMGILLRRRPSPALVVSCVALVVSSAGGAHAMSGAAGKDSVPTIHREYGVGTIGTGDVGTIVARCDRGYYAITGGYQTTSGNFLDVVTAAPQANGVGYAVTVAVGSKLGGAAPAHIKVVAVCARSREPLVPA